MHSYMKHILIMFALILALSSMYAAGETIYDIRVTGTQNIDPELVKSAISIQVGESLDVDEVAESIKVLYKMGIFSDIQMLSEPYRTGINLIIQVVENPVVASVSYVGMKSIKNERLDELVVIRQGSYWSDQLKNQLFRKLKTEYNGKGFANVTMEVNEKKLDKNRVALTVFIDEGKRVALKKISFIGNDSYEDKVLARRMKTKTANLLRAGRFEQEKFDTDLGNITNFYKKNGYIDVRVGPYELIPDGDRYLELVVHINEGEKYLYDKTEVEGNVQFTNETLMSNFTLQSNEVFDQEKYEKQLQKVYSLYFDEGYIYTNIQPEYVKADKKVVVKLKIEEGTRAKIRQIHFTGNMRTKEKVLRRQMEVAPGDYFRQSQVLRSQQNIYNLGFFEPDIKLDYTRINNAGDIDLQIDVQDKASGVANGGVGYNSTDGFVGELSLSMNNLFGNNWSSSVKWEFGGETQNFEFDFTNPNLYDTD
ncbi:MAG TPA: outer membrane protein assembly factor BamA, partial [Candidatus Cloacimonadota bacterium]|nr:outer membrane protein assembly factor BamA [Candidatus Cloacimonadota bacterium]